MNCCFKTTSADDFMHSTSATKSTQLERCVDRHQCILVKRHSSYETLEGDPRSNDIQQRMQRHWPSIYSLDIELDKQGLLRRSFGCRVHCVLVVVTKVSCRPYLFGTIWSFCPKSGQRIDFLGVVLKLCQTPIEHFFSYFLLKSHFELT